MKYLKSLLITSVMIIMILCLAGCESGNNSNSGNNTNTSNTSNSSSNNKNDTKKNNNEEEVDVMSLDFIANAEKQTANPEKGETIAIMHIKNYGDVKIKFFKDVAKKQLKTL